jgi:hypothetical protein
VEPTARPFRRLAHARRWRGRLGVIAASFALLLTGTAVASGAAQADPGTGGPHPIPIPRLTPVPCASLGPIEWFDVNAQLSEGQIFAIRSVVRNFDVAYGRFVENPTPIEIDGQWTATEARTVTLTFFFTQSVAVTSQISRGFSTTVSAATGTQVEQSHTTKVGVGAVAKIPPGRTMLGQYGLQSLDVVFDLQRVTRLSSAPQTCYLWLDAIITNNTAHVPTINEGWRFSLV